MDLEGSSWRWESAIRYYLVRAERDLLGDVTLVRTWGGLGSRRGHSLIECVSAEQVRAAVARIAVTRRRHGYWPTVP